jgi:GTPase
LKEYIINLSPRYDWHKNNNKTIFSINHKYNVKCIGTVFSGKLTNGKLTKNDKLLIGPFQGKWINVIAKSLHDNFRNNINELNAGESGCIAINSKKDFSKSKLKRGIILIDKIDNINNVINHFDAEVVILTKHSTTMKKGYSPIINCNTVSQTAKIVDIYDKEVLRCGDKCKVKFEFLFRPEYIKEDEHFVFRDGKTKGFGKIIKIY